MASFKKAFIAGLAGTAVMTLFAFVSGYFHLPKFDYQGMIASFLPMGSAVAWAVYFLIGIALAYVYGAFFRSRLPASSWGRGMIYALILWGAAGLILMPIMGMSFFYGSITVAVATLIGMELYGATVGYLYEH
jgi:hypothetical protein